MTKRPLAVTVIACIFIAVGILGFAYHVRDFNSRHLWVSIAIEAVRVVAVVIGVYLLRGANWARWGAVLWMGFHVAISAFNSVQQVFVHALLLLIFVYFLFRSTSERHFARDYLDRLTPP